MKREILDHLPEVQDIEEEDHEESNNSKVDEDMAETSNQEGEKVVEMAAESQEVKDDEKV